MPIYRYECNQCHEKFELRASYKEKEAGLAPQCPNCHGRQVRQLISGGLFFQSQEGVNFAGPACDPDRNPGCCG